MDWLIPIFSLIVLPVPIFVDQARDPCEPGEVVAIEPPGLGELVAGHDPQPRVAVRQGLVASGLGAVLRRGRLRGTA